MFKILNGKLKLLIPFICIVIYFFVFRANIAKASTIFLEPMTGQASINWQPNFFSPVINTTPASYGNKGIACLNGPTCQYEAPTSIQDDVIEFDAFSDGTPTSLLFSCRDANNYADEIRAFLHADGTTHLEIFNHGGGLGLDGLPNYDYSVGKHRLELDCIGSNLTLKEDGIILANTNFNADTYGSYNFIRFNLLATSNWMYSNYRLCDSGGCTSPTPTPTATPTPTPTIVKLNVPLIRQTSNPWQSQIYDSAQKWAAKNPTIYSWGCAIADVAMIFQYNGILKIPDNGAVNPGTLNTWLRSQSDGYIGNGLVNWLALQRLSRLIKLAFNNPGFTADALEYKRSSGYNYAFVSTNLQNNIPSILEEPGHFIVATGSANNIFSINDPYFDRHSLTDGYNNTFLSAGVYVPSHTDLSYIMLTGPEAINFALTGATGSAVGEQFTQQPLQDPTNQTLSSGIPIHVFYLQQPGDNNYHLSVSSSDNQAHSFQTYFYDINGNVKTFTENTISQNSSNSFDIMFSKTNQKNLSINKIVTFDSYLQDLQQLYAQKQIAKSDYNLFTVLTKNAEKFDKRGHRFLDKLILSQELVILRLSRGRGITDTGYAIIEEDISALLHS